MVANPWKSQYIPSHPTASAGNPPRRQADTPQRKAGRWEVLKYLVQIYLKSSQLVDTIYIIKNTWRFVLLAKIYISV